MKKAYLRSTTKEGRICQTEVTWGQWAANRAKTAWAWLCSPRERIMAKLGGGHF